MKLPEIIGIGGTNGAGKDTLAELRAQHVGSVTASLSDIIRRELTKHGVPHERVHMRALSKKWRLQYGSGALATQTLTQYFQDKPQKGYKGLSIVSLRHPGVVHEIRRSGGLIIWIDGDRRARFERIKAASRNRTEDEVTYEEFCAQEDAEMYPPQNDEEALNMNGVRDLADVLIENNFSTAKEYKRFLVEKFELDT
jgi:dephospho-CoA kinase